MAKTEARSDQNPVTGISVDGQVSLKPETRHLDLVKTGFEMRGCEITFDNVQTVLAGRERLEQLERNAVIERLELPLTASQFPQVAAHTRFPRMGRMAIGPKSNIQPGAALIQNLLLAELDQKCIKKRRES